MESSLMVQPEEKMREGEDEKIKVELESTLMMQPEEKMGQGEGEDEKTKVELDSTLMMQLEEKIEEGEDKKIEEDDMDGDSDDSLYCDAKRWHKVLLSGIYQRNEQVALLLVVLKCNKSVVPSIYRFRNLHSFEAYLSLHEAKKFRELEEVEGVPMLSMDEYIWNAKRTKSRISQGLQKRKKQKLSIGSILLERRQNKEKWMYNEDLEPGSKIEDLSEDDSSDDYDGFSWRYERYYGFDESGKRWYKVSLVDDKNRDDHVALLLDVLQCEGSEIDSIYLYKANHLFEAHMTEEEADRVAGLEEVEYVEPRCYVISFA